MSSGVGRRAESGGTARGRDAQRGMGWSSDARGAATMMRANGQAARATGEDDVGGTGRGLRHDRRISGDLDGRDSPEVSRQTCDP